MRIRYVYVGSHACNAFQAREATTKAIGIPTQFQGTWADDAQACSQLKSGLNTDKIIRIGSNEIIGYEFKCNLQSGSANGSTFEGKFSCGDTDGNYSATYVLGGTGQRPLQLSTVVKGKKSPATGITYCMASRSPDEKGIALSAGTPKCRDDSLHCTIETMSEFLARRLDLSAR